MSQVEQINVTIVIKLDKAALNSEHYKDIYL